jgi:hypothetical protein
MSASDLNTFHAFLHLTEIEVLGTSSPDASELRSFGLCYGQRMMLWETSSSLNFIKSQRPDPMKWQDWTLPETSAFAVC